MDLCGDVLYIEKEEQEDNIDIVSSRRINIDYAEEAKYFLYRFTIKDNKFISVPIKKDNII